MFDSKLFLYFFKLSIYKKKKKFLILVHVDGQSNTYKDFDKFVWDMITFLFPTVLLTNSLTNVKCVH